MAFHFLQFAVEDEQSALRVGTDAMLLGSWANPEKADRILDIGTGCGVLALMMAQKSGAMIEAIEIDRLSVIEAQKNFVNSPWASRITAIHDSLQAFACNPNAGYGFIISNPPYFSNSLKSPSARINQARHNESLALLELAQIVGRLLSPDGCFALILPSGPAEIFQSDCTGFGLYLSRRLVVYPKPDQQPKRVLMEFKKNKIANPESAGLTIFDVSGKFTTEYLTMTGCFHNFGMV